SGGSQYDDGGYQNAPAQGGTYPPAGQHAPGAPAYDAPPTYNNEPPPAPRRQAAPPAAPAPVDDIDDDIPF
ncbi:MAG: single-stranded DNA-binding protein, partial [Eikenella sp.]|nr:single-stranded DNA-binding protein [Eikenella sp.]